MSNPKHQHFIPKSYLKNFAQQEQGKFFVEAKLKSEDKPKEKLLSIQDICVDKNLYTIPHAQGDDKYKIERYYAENIDAVYPEIYALLTDSSITYITLKQRAEIVMTTMSLFFRTPKFLNLNERRVNLILDYAVKNHIDEKGIVKYKFRDYDFNFHIDEIENVKTHLRIKNKIKFLQEHLKTWHQFIEFKVKSGLVVYRMYQDNELITSDNPVSMRSMAGNPFNVFDPTNIISVPLDNKHYLTIMPNTEEATLDRIHRGERDIWFGLTTNSEVEENSEDWILGKPGSVTKHLNDQIKYNALTAENFQAVEDTEERAVDAIKLWELINRTGFRNQQVADLVKEQRKKRIHKDDPEMQKIVLELAQAGFLTV
jgi:hypothetical protein